jgi:uncharacterized protein (TIGR02147 family)
MATLHTHETLRKYFERKRDFSAAFSLRSLARRVEVSPSFLSRILSGQKPVPYPLLLRLESALDIEPEVFASIRLAHQLEESSAVVARKGKAEMITQLADWDLATPEAIGVLRQWYFIPILEFTRLQGYDGKAETIAKYLRLPLPTVEQAVKELTSLKLLVEEDGLLVKTRRKLRIGSGKPNPDIRRYHSAMLERARRELLSASPEDFEKRLMTGITLSGTPEKIAKAKQKLAECLHEIANDLISEQGTEVYHLAAQLFPLTKKP